MLGKTDCPNFWVREGDVAYAATTPGSGPASEELIGDHPSLRHGNVRDSDWRDRDGDGRADGRTPLPLPFHDEVAAYAIAVTTQEEREDGDDKQSWGDGLVPIASALGQHADPAFDLRIPEARRWVGYGINHLELLGSAEVYARIVDWLRGQDA